MAAQIKAADDFGASGWMFWNPRNLYPTGVWYSGNGKKKQSRPQASSGTTRLKAREQTDKDVKEEE